MAASIVLAECHTMLLLTHVLLSPEMNAAAEEGLVILLDAGGKVTGRIAFQGDSGDLKLPWRSIMAQILLSDCKGIILLHSHPSGDPRPSQADIRTTRMLCRMMRLVGIKLCDHVIATSQARYSFRDSGML